MAEVLAQAGVTHVPGLLTESELRGIRLGRVGFQAELSGTRTTQYTPVQDTLRITPQVICTQLGQDERLIVVDEYDRVADLPTDTAFADLIKQLSDIGSGTKVGPSGFIVGFPESGVSPTDERSSFEGEELLVLQQFMAFRRGLPRNARG